MWSLMAGSQKPWSRGTRGTKEGFIFVGRFESWTNNCEIFAIIVVHLSAETMKTLQKAYLIGIKYKGSVFY